MNKDQCLSHLDLDLVSVFDHAHFGVRISSTDFKLIYRNDIFTRWLPEIIPGDTLFIVEASRMDAESMEFDENQRHRLLLSLFKEAKHVSSVYTFPFMKKQYQFNITHYPLYDRDGNEAGILEITENRSENFQLSQSLLHAKRFENVGRLASGIAHDFNNILQVIIGHTEILMKNYADDDRIIRSMDIILTSGRKASALTRQLLSFSRKQESEYSIFPPKTVIHNLHKLLHRMLGEDVSMKLNTEDNNWNICGDESQIEQIFLNLAVNAREAMPMGGKIDILIEDVDVSENEGRKFTPPIEGCFIHIRFSDNGHGMDQETMEHIFDPFFTTKFKGSGLGLSTVYSIVRQHQGAISVQSQPGKCTVFDIYLPKADGNCQICDPEDHDQAIEPGSSGSVLIVEDDVMVAELAFQTLAMHGFQVDTADGIRSALKKIEQRSYDIYLVDIVLPDGTGVELVEIIKAHNPMAGILLSSGYTEDKPQIKNALEKGYEFLHKPYTITTLLKMCRQLMNKT